MEQKETYKTAKFENNYVFEKDGDELILNYQGNKFKPRTQFDSDVMKMVLNTEKEILALSGRDIVNAVDVFALEPKTTNYEILSQQNGKLYGCTRKKDNPHSQRQKGSIYQFMLAGRPYETRTNSGFMDTVGQLDDDGTNWKCPSSRIIIEITDRDFAVHQYAEHNDSSGENGGFVPWVLDPYGVFSNPKNLEKCEELIKQGLNKIRFNIESH